MHKTTLHAVHFSSSLARSLALTRVLYVCAANADYVYIEISFSDTQHSVCGKTNVKSGERREGKREQKEGKSCVQIVHINNCFCLHFF